MKMTLLQQKMKIIFPLHGYMLPRQKISKLLTFRYINNIQGINTLVDTCLKTPQTLTLSDMALVSNNSAFSSVYLCKKKYFVMELCGDKEYRLHSVLIYRVKDTQSHIANNVMSI